MSGDKVLEGAETVIHQVGVVVQDLEKTVEFLTALVLQRGFEMWCNAAHHPCVEGGQHDRPDRDDPTNGFGDPRY